jgi:catechol 2,3-dioxygenase-like lactoylglutathione lyase family enzyme
MVTFGKAAPSIYVHDMQQSLAYYCDVLGFSVAFTNGSPVSFAVLRRDDAQLHLSVRPTAAGSCHVHIILTDLDSFYARLVAAGAILRQSPKVQAWGLRDIVVADQDGNTFEFAEMAVEPASV